MGGGLGGTFFIGGSGPLAPRRTAPDDDERLPFRRRRRSMSPSHIAGVRVHSSRQRCRTCKALAVGEIKRTTREPPVSTSAASDLHQFTSDRSTISASTAALSRRKTTTNNTDRKFFYRQRTSVSLGRHTFILVTLSLNPKSTH